MLFLRSVNWELKRGLIMKKEKGKRVLFRAAKVFHDILMVGQVITLTGIFFVCRFGIVF